MISCRPWLGDIGRGQPVPGEASCERLSGVAVGRVGLGDAEADGGADADADSLAHQGVQVSSSQVTHDGSGDSGAGAGAGLRGAGALVAGRVAARAPADVPGAGTNRGAAPDDGGAVTVGDEVRGRSGLAVNGADVGGSTAPAGAAADGGSPCRASSAASSVRVAASPIAARNVPTAPLVTSRPTPRTAVRRPGTRS